MAETFQLAEAPQLEPRYNIAPSQQIPVIRLPDQPGERQVAMLRWGLIPKWAKDISIGNRMINARSETVTEKTSFKNAFEKRRCLVPMDGFYEWKKEGARKQPYFIRMKNQKPFAVAGLWERWASPEEETIESCALLTCQANDLIKPIHDRMPVILEPEAWDSWLNPEFNDTDRIKTALLPLSSNLMETYRVWLNVNNPKNDDPQSVIPI